MPQHLGQEARPIKRIMGRLPPRARLRAVSPRRFPDYRPGLAIVKVSPRRSRDNL